MSHVFTGPTNSYEFDTRDDAVAVATRMMVDGWDVMIRDTVLVTTAPMSVFPVTIGAVGLRDRY